MTTHNNKIVGEGLTYDDVLLVPAYSEILPREVSIKTKFTKNITINIPIISAAMDTVTESDMAIAIAREGGIGVLHKNMSIEAQANEVRKVKRSESGMILSSSIMMKLFEYSNGFNTSSDAAKILIVFTPSPILDIFPKLTLALLFIVFSTPFRIILPCELIIK